MTDIDPGSSPLRVTGAEIISTKIPTRRPHAMAIGTTRHQESVYLRLDTNKGLSGWGEAPHMIGHSHAGETQASVALMLEERLVPIVLGQDPLRIEAISADLDRALPMNPRAKSAINIALYDLVGKWLGTPVFNLLGGMVRPKIPLSWSLGIMPATDAATEAVQMVQEGFHILKVKVGAGRTWTEDVEVVAAIRQAVGPEIQIRADANQGYDVTTAIAATNAMAEFGLESMEQPVPAWDLAGMAEVRATSPCYIMADESVNSPREVYEVAKLRAADLVSIYINTGGGITAAHRMATIAHTAGIGGYIGGALEGPVAARACLHFGSSSPAITFGCEMVGQFLLAADIGTEPIPFVDGCLVVPSEPGLGVDLDLDRVAEYEVGRTQINS